MLSRGATIGILGDGQLGRMLAQTAQRRGYKVRGYGQDAQGPLAQVVADFHRGGFDDHRALETFASGCDALTCEFESVPLSAIEIASQNAHFYPRSKQKSPFALAQDRLFEKQAAQAAKLTTAPFFAVDSLAQLEESLALLGGKGILKTRREGYDGKGQWRLKPETNLSNIWVQTPQKDLLIEGLVPFDFETSLIIARNDHEQVAYLSMGDNIHQNGILRECRIPGRVTQLIQDAAVQLGHQFMERHGIVGLIAIEFFVLPSRELVFNEFAPRPHNSGHWSLEGADRSQFDLLIDVMEKGTMVQPRLLYPTQMQNILGEEILNPEKAFDLFWHDYGKAEPKAGRKMGHVTKIDVKRSAKS